MSLQWMIAAGFLYSEVFLLFLFCLPFISPSRWSKIFNSHIVKTIFTYGNFYFNVFIVINVVFFADSIREIMKYQKAENIDLKNNPQSEVQYLMRLFRAQRNLYIAGFTLFLLFVLRRIITMLLKQANLEATSAASLQQAQNVSDHCQKVMEENENLKLQLQGTKKAEKKEDEKKNESEKEMEKEKADEEEKEKGKEKEDENEGYDEVDKENEIIELKSEIEKMKKECEEKDQELTKVQKDFEALTKQAEGVNREYDRLLEEHDKTKKLLKMKTNENTADEENKKEN